MKDLGRIQLWVLHRPGSEPVELDRRLGGRWERLAEVFHDLDELREKGERLFTGARAAGDAVSDAGGTPGGEAVGGPGAAGPSGGGAEGGDPERPERE